MTKKDYELVAYTLFGEVFADNETLCEAWEDAEELYQGIVSGLAMAFKQHNPRFDYDKFVKACGLKQ